MPAHKVPAIACGMVGSRQGWREVPYVPTPAGLAQLSSGLVTLDAGGGTLLHLVPGVLETNDPDTPDVIRGEETQALGAFYCLQASDALLVMPGTHSKWARLRDHRLVSFRTTMTGELFALLLSHSILGRGVAEAAPATPAAHEAAFRSGVLAGHGYGAFARLFQARALTLTGALEPACVPDYLSGLLIGEELRIAATDLAIAGQVAITGDASLCERYERAFAIIGAGAPEPIHDTALDGLLRIAFQAGLLPDFIPIGAR
jgi:2-dehydro-3-deoxygalactonokinase